MLIWGFGSVMATQFSFLIGLWLNRKFNLRAFIYLVTYLVLFGFAGYSLFKAIDASKYHPSMISENASFYMGQGGILWAFSVLFLLLGIQRLVKAKK